MMKRLMIVATLIATPASAEVWATGKCTTQYGEKIEYMLHDGKGFISYNGSEPEPMFSEKKDKMGIITHIGSHGNMTMAIDLNTGRGYYVVKFDNGNGSESNVSCKLGAVNK
jgi:hypothetical protein